MKTIDNITRNIFICNTSFQIMMAVLFKLTNQRYERTDLVISNIIYKSEDLYKNISYSKVFDNVYYIKDYELNYVQNFSTNFEKIKRDFNSLKTINNLLPNIGIYDCLYVSDTLFSINSIYRLLKKKNKDLKVFFYEEGPISVLCDHGNHFKESKEYNSLKGKIYNRIVGLKNINGHFSGAYTTVARHMKKSYFSWYEMPRIADNKIDDYVNILNNFWKYKKNKQLESKVIFLEESFYIDGKENKDVEIVNDICRVVGKKHVMVKLHPRTRKNRFKDLGIKYFPDNNVPWELISLNGDMQNAVLVCMGSGAIIHPKLYWGIKQNAIALLNCHEYHFKYLDSEYYKCFYKICEEKELAFLPNNKADFLKKLKLLHTRNIDKSN